VSNDSKDIDYIDNVKQTLPTRAESHATSLVESRESQPSTVISFNNGSERRSFPYTYLQDFGMNQKGDIDFAFSSGLVTVTGKNLAPIYEKLTRYRISQLSVQQGHSMTSDSTYIDSITIKLHREEEDT